MQEDAAALRWRDSLVSRQAKELPVYRYDPNFLSDYQGYMLGMFPEEIDRIFAYRAQGNRIQSEEEFWTVTEIAGERRNTIAPRLRFRAHRKAGFKSAEKQKPELPVRRDINKATADELMKVRGIGPVLSERIVKFRDRLGGFLVREQLYDVYGLDPEVVERMFMRYTVVEKPEIAPININTASADEIASLVYLSKAVAYRIIRHREQYGPLETLEELTKIEDFPADKIDRISLYLSL